MTDGIDIPTSGLLDTCVLIDYASIADESLPDFQAISAVTLAELHAGPHAAQNDPNEQVRRTQTLHKVEHTFPDPLPFDEFAARVFGSVTLLFLTAGRKPRKYTPDMMIASVAIANRLPLYTRNPKDFAPLQSMLEIREV